MLFQNFFLFMVSENVNSITFFFLSISLLSLWPFFPLFWLHNFHLFSCLPSCFYFNVSINFSPSLFLEFIRLFTEFVIVTCSSFMQYRFSPFLSWVQSLFSILFLSMSVSIFKFLIKDGFSKPQMLIWAYLILFRVLAYSFLPLCVHFSKVGVVNFLSCHMWNLLIFCNISVWTSPFFCSFLWYCSVFQYSHY